MITSSNIQSVEKEIRRIAEGCGRSPDDITLVAVTKAFPVEYMIAAYKHGLKTMGESRIQEAENKLPQFKYRDDTELHFIGHLQSNKVNKVVPIFDVIQSVDSEHLAKRIGDAAVRIKKRQKIYLQVNTGKDDNKFGIDPADALSMAEEVHQYPGIELEGIMTIAPMTNDKNILHRVFSATRSIRDKILKTGIHTCQALSMGMSNDYHIAIQEGATHVRIGRALFGERPQWKPSTHNS
ncbi:MAG: YggS family pyridoxal phosphate-dependent enzyme [Candidatus Marinimicrobia bacterium]|nr:YggS family pyridoxal phosphate-dependent enzyme [Candidatus Neomarinimicrobiota bacterium]